jgi:hypothetical protein
MKIVVKILGWSEIIAAVILFSYTIKIGRPQMGVYIYAIPISLYFLICGILVLQKKRLLYLIGFAMSASFIMIACFQSYLHL